MPVPKAFPSPVSGCECCKLIKHSTSLKVYARTYTIGLFRKQRNTVLGSIEQKIHIFSTGEREENTEIKRNKPQAFFPLEILGMQANWNTTVFSGVLLIKAYSVVWEISRNKIRLCFFFFFVLCLLKNLTILLVYPSSINPIPRPIQKHMMNTKMFCELLWFLHSLIGEDGLAQGGWHKHHKFSINS